MDFPIKVGDFPQLCLITRGYMSLNKRKDLEEVANLLMKLQEDSPLEMRIRKLEM